MTKTQIRGPQVVDGSIQRDDLDTATAGQAVTRKIVAGTGINIGSTGVDAGTGDVTINKTASGNSLLILCPGGNEPPAANFATPDTRNLHPVLDFDTTTQEAAIWTCVLPRHYAGGGITVYLHWAATSATSGTIGWDVAFERIGDSQQDLDSDGFASAQTVTAATVPGTSGHVEITNVAVTNGANMDSIAVGESFRIRVRRDVANDNAAGDAELVAVELKET